MDAALDLNIPNYASAVVTTEEIVASIASLDAEKHEIGASEETAGA